MSHTWIEVGGRRWCLACGSFQVLRGGHWADDKAMIGPWPGYAPTQLEHHPSAQPQAVGSDQGTVPQGRGYPSTPQSG